ncbi:hypothetical protein K2X83_00215 [Patescibacteria group bacterium]|nr:hypothetical protein [Patescibacteria group bacterium]
MNAPKFFTMPLLADKTAGWSASKIRAVKNRFLTRASRLEKGGVSDRVRGTRSLVQALAEFEGNQFRREEAAAKDAELRAA